jgi:hypothetical protein
MSWHVCCSSDRCTRLGRQAETRFSARELTSDGRVLAPYDPDALPLIRSMPGAWWDAKTKCWRVSLAPEHRPRLLALAAQLRLAVATELGGEPATKEQSR